VGGKVSSLLGLEAPLQENFTRRWTVVGLAFVPVGAAVNGGGEAVDSFKDFPAIGTGG